MNTVVFPEAVVGKLMAGAYVRADEARAKITELETRLVIKDDAHAASMLVIAELERQLSRYQGGVEVDGFYSETYENLTGDPCITLCDRLLLNQNQRVRVIVLPDECTICVPRKAITSMEYKDGNDECLRADGGNQDAAGRD